MKSYDLTDLLRHNVRAKSAVDDLTSLLANMMHDAELDVCIHNSVLLPPYIKQLATAIQKLEVAMLAANERLSHEQP